MSRRSTQFMRCSDCGHGVYRGVRRCPHCGHRMRWNVTPLVAWAIAATIAVLLGIVLAEIITTDDRPAPTPTFDRP